MRPAALLVAAAVALAGCGDGEEAADGNGVDRAFAAAMVPHHESAVEMARLAQERGTSVLVKRLAKDIIRTQTAEIARLRGEDAALAAEGVTPGVLEISQHAMGIPHDLGRLRTAGDFDTAFLQAMIPHHVGAVEMSKEELRRGTDPDLRALAQTIITAQQREIEEMRSALSQAHHADDEH